MVFTFCIYLFTNIGLYISKLREIQLDLKEEFNFMSHFSSNFPNFGKYLLHLKNQFQFNFS